MWTKENRAKYNRDHLRYPSDLTDDEWTLVEPFIPPAKSGGGKRRTDMREVMNGVMYILSTGCQWRYLPKDFPPRSDQGQEAAYSRRYVGSVTARHRSFCRHSGPRWRHRIAGDAVRSVSIPREAVCRQCLSRADFWQRARQNPPLSRNRNHPTIRSSERVRAATQALDCRTHHCLAQPLPPPRQGLGKSQPKRPRILETRVHSSHVAKAL